MNNLGYNYRMTDIQAALGSSQLNLLQKFIIKRNKIANYYKKKLSKKIIIQQVDKNNLSTYHLFIIRVDSRIRNNIVRKLNKKNIITSLHYTPIYRHHLYKKKFNYLFKDFPESEKYYKEAISIPIFYELTKQQQDKIISIINSFF